MMCMHKRERRIFDSCQRECVACWVQFSLKHVVHDFYKAGSPTSGNTARYSLYLRSPSKCASSDDLPGRIVVPSPSIYLVLSSHIFKNNFHKMEKRIP